jgi:hypothetical protein
MNTILVWLLIGLPFTGPSNRGTQSATVIERFEDLKECERVANYIMANRTTTYDLATPRVGCIQARVVVAK